jgi:hypothetical protein
MAAPTKEYQAWIRVKLSESILPVPVLTREGLEAYLMEHLDVGEPDSPIVSLGVGDPAERRPRRRY